MREDAFFASLDSPQRSTCERTIALPAREAACLVAEAFAYEFPNTQRDALRPIARAERVALGHWRIAYVRGQGGFLPLSNGRFERESTSSRLTGSASRSRLFELLPGLRFVRGERLGGFGSAKAFLSVEITASGPRHCTVRGSSLDPDTAWGSEKLRRILRLLAGAEALRDGFSLCAEGSFDAAAARLRQTLRDFRGGVSHVHDPLLANAFAALGTLEYERGNLTAARKAFARGRLLLPADTRLLTLEARMRERLAQARRSHDAISRAARVESADTLRARRLIALQHKSGELVESTKSSDGIEAISRAALHAGDPTAALAWANRALDSAAGSADALRLKADAMTAHGRHRRADQLRRLAQIARPHHEDLAWSLTTDTRGIEPALALRRILRSKTHAPALLAAEATQELVSLLGPERCLRICRTEGVDVAVLESAIRWFASTHSDRSRYLKQVLEAKERSARTTGVLVELEPREIELQQLGGASGLRLGQNRRRQERTEQKSRLAAPGR